jgi:hypothetical protein
MDFPKPLIGRLAWLSSAAAAVTACVFVVLTVKEAAPLVLQRAPHAKSDSDRRVEPVSHSPSAVASEVISEAVRAANAEAALELDRRITHCRQYAESLVDREGISAFVDEVTSYSQKFHRLFTGSSEERLWTSLRESIVDESELTEFVTSTAQGYKNFLDEQDREILRIASVEDADRGLVQTVQTFHPNCRLLLEPIVALAADEAGTDVGRKGLSLVAGFVAAAAANKVAHDMRLNDFEEGSWEDQATQIGVGLGAEHLVDKTLDPKEKLVARFTNELINLRDVWLFGDPGVKSVLEDLREAHERARAEFLSAGGRR